MTPLPQQPVKAGQQGDSGPVLELKPPRQPFSATVQTGCQAIFLHPGYDDGHNILLILPGLDSSGIHHETARIACAILADSRWDGFLSYEKDGPKLEQGPDSILPCRRYYFCIEGDDQYPIVPSFNHFRCPPELPASWLQPAAPIKTSPVEDAGKRDIICRITGSLLPNETAHIIPQAQSDWWQRNSMFTYAMNPDQSFDTNCADNTILLRRDLHKMWDDHRFAIVPKAGKWVVHILMSSSTVELEETYHNLELQPLFAVSRYFFFCRFALAIISKSPFLRQQTARRLVILAGSGLPHVRTMSADDYQRLINTTSRGSSRSQSPKKRQRSVQGEIDSSDSPSEAEPTPKGRDFPERGRPRKRRLSHTSDSGDHHRLPRNGRASDQIWTNRCENGSPLQKRRHKCQGLTQYGTPSRSTSPNGPCRLTLEAPSATRE
ncbi:unnamed protein product [Clonostachys rhizophaga]|uniref:HNH nuclease domain-containing protein n=1 Tax=Clonostachys rhizophaga TaxID=160324 RepID=A0A9N9VGK3_9HYPO|nr:unnamed protein product [Clonostachys rhizophaga]